MHDESKVMLLTGAASGIGKHLARALAARGHRLLATDVNRAALETAAQSWPKEKVALATLDVRSPADWEAALAQAVSRFGGLDVLLSVAGYLRPGQAITTDAAEVDRHFDINVKGVVHGTRVVGRYFAERKAGHIINIGSLASLAAVPGLPLYVASKFAVRGFSISSAMELAPHGVAVSLVMPDAVQTPMLDLQVDSPDAALTFSGASTPLTVEDIELALVEEVLPRRPLELTLPKGRGALARFAVALPGLANSLAPVLARKGAKAQAAAKAKRHP